MFDPKQELRSIVSKVKCVGGCDTSRIMFGRVLSRLDLCTKDPSRYHHPYQQGKEILSFTTVPDLTSSIVIRIPRNEHESIYDGVYLHRTFKTPESHLVLRTLGLLTAMVTEHGNYTKYQRIEMMGLLYKAVIGNDRFARSAYELYRQTRPIDPEYLSGDQVIHYPTNHATRRLYIGRVHKL